MGTADKVALDGVLYTSGVDPEAFSRYYTDPVGTGVGFTLSTLTGGLSGGRDLTKLSLRYLGGRNFVSRSLNFAGLAGSSKFYSAFRGRDRVLYAAEDGISLSGPPSVGRGGEDLIYGCMNGYMLRLGRCQID